MFWVFAARLSRWDLWREWDDKAFFEALQKEALALSVWRSSWSFIVSYSFETRKTYLYRARFTTSARRNFYNGKSLQLPLHEGCLSNPSAKIITLLGLSAQSKTQAALLGYHISTDFFAVIEIFDKRTSRQWHASPPKTITSCHSIKMLLRVSHRSAPCQTMATSQRFFNALVTELLYMWWKRNTGTCIYFLLKC